MPIEIERKFLVANDDWKGLAKGTPYRQGYLNRDPHRTVRVRVAGQSAFITVKGITVGTTRQEFEYSIPTKDAEPLLALCEGPLIEKIRYVVEHDGRRWEIDEFSGDNSRLILAEVELTQENEVIDLPLWAGREVSNDQRYFNSNLSVNPICRWVKTTT